MEKICRSCKILKNHSEFNRNKRQKDGYSKICRECDKAYNKLWYRVKNPKAQIQEGFKRCSLCKEVKELEDFYPRGLNKVAPQCKKCQSELYSKWRAKGGKEWENIYAKKRKAADPSYKLRNILRLRLLDALKRTVKGGTVTKKHSAVKPVGCTLLELREYLEKKFVEGMTWQNHGTLWEIDHITPISWFNIEDLEEQKRCFHYTNLQPLFKTTQRINGKVYMGNRNKRNLSNHKQ